VEGHEHPTENQDGEKSMRVIQRDSGRTYLFSKRRGYTTWAFISGNSFKILTGEGDGFVPCSVYLMIGENGRVTAHGVQTYPNKDVKL
jgi:hypothetical protein